MKIFEKTILLTIIIAFLFSVNNAQSPDEDEV